jgi:PAS domain S-box-containing protein
MDDPRQVDVTGVSPRRSAVRLGCALAVTCVGASALAAQRVVDMGLLLLLSDADWKLILAVLAALVGGGGLGGFVVRLVMLRPERRKLDVDMVDTLLERVRLLDGDVAKARAAVDQAHADALAANERAEAAEARADSFLAEVSALREQFSAATLSMAATLVYDDDLHDFEDMWDLLDVPVIFTSQGGRWDIANVAACRQFGCSREELLGFGWQRYCLALDDTMREEEAATRRRVWGYVNEWRRDDGTTFFLEWFAAKKKNGKTMAFAFPSHVRPTRSRRRDDPVQRG